MDALAIRIATIQVLYSMGHVADRAIEDDVPLIEPMHEPHNLGAIEPVGDRDCPLCHVQLIAHDGRACCSCCGTTRQRDREHWEEIWAMHESSPGAA